MEKIRFVIEKSNNLDQDVNNKRVYIWDNPLILLKYMILAKKNNIADRDAFEWWYDIEWQAPRLTAFAILMELTNDLEFAKKYYIEFEGVFLRNKNKEYNAILNSNFEIKWDVIYEWIINKK